MDLKYTQWILENNKKYQEMLYKISFMSFNNKNNKKVKNLNLSFITEDLIFTKLTDTEFLKYIERIFKICFESNLEYDKKHQATNIYYTYVSNIFFKDLMKYKSKKIKYKLYPTLLCETNFYQNIVVPHINNLKTFAKCSFFKGKDFNNYCLNKLDSLNNTYSEILKLFGYAAEDLYTHNVRFISLYELLLSTTFAKEFFKHNRF